jgi:predicted RNase H-like nuclease (RuvC/YqgF family)
MSEERWHEQANVRRLEASNEALEVKLDKADARIEALEAALREILGGAPDAFDLARAALAPEQDK